MADALPPPPSRLRRFARWRREADGWRYGLLAVCWLGLTVSGALVPAAIWLLVGRLWLEAVVVWGVLVVVASGCVFLLLFEVGLATVIASAWSSRPTLEHEGEAGDKLERKPKGG